jgi:hypothetical protein
VLNRSTPLLKINPDMISMPRASNIVIFEIYRLHDVGAAGMLLESHVKFTN